MGSAFPQLTTEEIQQVNTFYAKNPVLVVSRKNKHGRGVSIESGMFHFAYTKELQGYGWVLTWSSAVVRTGRTSTLEAALKASQVALNEEGQQLVRLKVTP
jgi:hypothetical protein